MITRMRAALAIGLVVAGCGAGLVERAREADPSLVEGEAAPIVAAENLQGTERTIRLGPLEGTPPPAAGPEHGPGHGHGHGPAAPAAERFACPMHAEVVAGAPGRCPKCGMNLQPEKRAP